ncbi:hypothetical protein [Bythopirellula polymerisocia]|uniref:Uncharacterized protein n=1 Tax=Bythopirellula polymerisocia TaxID=2528003 RepID=A0A5C6CQS7_9BACT|nr:hypothetical protein [Bythopirellula polymerisocia]TWU25904.1 hypothetical protein Pla144_31180 [Bythopirellula polymerisocia]
MPRTVRVSCGGCFYPILNRELVRQEVFHKDGDFAFFVDLMVAANERLPMRLADCSFS